MGFAIVLIISVTVIIGTLCFLCNRNCERAEKERWKRDENARETRSENEE